MADSLGVDKQVQNLIADFGGEKFAEVLKHYNGKFSLPDMFTHLWGLEEAHNCLMTEIKRSKKSKRDSEKLRDEGNKAYGKKKLSEALKLYSLSVLSAPHPPLDDGRPTAPDDQSSLKDPDETDLGALPLAYANRSAVLFELKQYNECLNDIARAMQFGYPDSLKHKLIKRTEGCAVALESTQDQERLVTHYSMKPSLLADPNPNLPGLSSSVKVAFGTSVGRYLVAQREIFPGDVLVVEDVYTSCLDNQHLQSHCSTCYTRCLIPLPCPNCKEVVFCSEGCRSRGLSGQHHLECNIIADLGAMNTCMIVPFRILTKIPFDRIKKLLVQYRQEQSSGSPLALGFNEKGIYDSRDYRTAYCLVTNQEKRDSRSLFTICVGAFILTKLLLNCKRYFVDDEKKPIEPSKDDLMEVGGALFRHIMSDLSNGHRYGELRAPGPDGNPDIHNIGSWISPTINLANHSCDQSVITCNKGNLGIMTAIQLIQPGQEVTTGYLKGYGIQNLSMRKEILTKHYFFDCVCRPCKENWPTFNSLPDNFQMKCLDCLHFINRSDNKCSSCGLDYSVAGESTYNCKMAEQDIGLAILGFLRMRKDFDMTSLEYRYDDIRKTKIVIEIMGRYVLLPNKIYANAKAFLAGLLSNERDYVKVRKGF